ncbi:hypothetical protein GCM10010344_74930 [Streptomyces bluensis]|nr:hypothetical protein GCM10010344_74930 [Streptomyces bluensis]
MTSAFTSCDEFPFDQVGRGRDEVRVTEAGPMAEHAAVWPAALVQPPHHRAVAYRATPSNARYDQGRTSAPQATTGPRATMPPV